MNNQMDRGDTFMLGLIAGTLLGIALAIGILITDDAQMQDVLRANRQAQRCEVLRHRAHTAADTLIVIRHGCSDPATILEVKP